MRELVAFPLFVALLAATPAARADDKAEAQKHFKAGVALIKAEDFGGAAAARARVKTGHLIPEKETRFSSGR